MNNLPPLTKTVVERCRQRALERFRKYGASWLVLRPTTLTDLLFIKASRIRTVEERGKQLVGEDIMEDFMALVNYAVLELIALNEQLPPPSRISEQWFTYAYNRQIEHALALMSRKNHDYGDAWRQMRISSFIDLILSKLARIKQMENRSGTPEDISAELYDITNYALLALIRLEEGNHGR